MAEDLRERAQMLVKQFERAELSEDHDYRYAIAYVVAHGREIAQAYLAECRAHEQTQNKLDAARALLSQIQWAAADSFENPWSECPVCGEGGGVAHAQ